MPEPGALPPDDDRELSALARGLDFADGFALFFARVDARPARRALVDALRQRLPDGLDVLEVELARDATDLEAVLSRRLAEAPPAERRAVFVYGVEDVLSEARRDERDAFLRVLNFKRENLQRAVPHPVVLWVPEFALRILAVNAPDLWAWRSSVLEFSSPLSDALDRSWRQVEAGDTEDEYARMTPDERRDRARTLEALLDDYSARDDADRPDVLRIRTDLADRLGRLARDLADYPAAERYARQSLDLAERLGDEAAVAHSVNNLGTVLRDRGNLDGAEAAYRHALAIDEATHGPEHSTVAIRLSNLGTVLHDQGDLDGAEAAYRRALVIDEMTYGPDHPAVATRLNNIGVVLRNRGDLDGAEAAHRHALEIDEAAYGPSHPTVAIHLGNLGVVLRDRGDLGGAEAAHRHALIIGEATYGPDHPAVATYLIYLGSVLYDQGDLDGAEAVLRRASTINKRVLGPDHPRSQMCRDGLATIRRVRAEATRPPDE